MGINITLSTETQFYTEYSTLCESSHENWSEDRDEDLRMARYLFIYTMIATLKEEIRFYQDQDPEDDSIKKVW